MIGSLIYIGISYQLAAMTLHFRLSYPMNINLQESNTLALFSGVSYVRLLLFQPLTVFNWKSLGKYVSSSNKNIIHLPHADFYAIYSFFEFFFILLITWLYQHTHFFKPSFQSQVPNEALIHLSSHVFWQIA